MLEVKQQQKQQRKPRKKKPEADRELPPEGLSIAEAARHTGVSAHTLRYYERAGLVVTPTDRASGGRRRYHRLDLEWIRICTRFRATGMPIRSIRRYAELVVAGRGNEQERLALLEEHRAEVVAKLAELRECRELIDHKIDVYRARLATGDADQLWAPSPPPPGSAADETGTAVPPPPPSPSPADSQGTAPRPRAHVRERGRGTATPVS